MKCKFCGKEIEEGSRYCGFCGKEQPQVKYCIKCGHEIGLEDRWCGYCGAEQNPISTDEHHDTNTKQENNSAVLENIEKNDSSYKKYLIGGLVVLVIIVVCIIGYSRFESTEITSGIDTLAVDTTTTEPMQEETQKEEINTLKVYFAKSDISAKFVDQSMDGYMKFKSGEFISDSERTFYSIKDVSPNYYLYDNGIDGDYVTCHIPKSKVSIKTYKMGLLPVTYIKKGITIRHYDESYSVFIGSINGHKFYKMDYDKDKYVVDYEATNKFKKMLVIENSQGDAYLIPIQGDYVSLYKPNKHVNELHDEWVNYDFNLTDCPDRRSFDSNGNLQNDMYLTVDKTDDWESFCYIPSINSLYIGNGQFVPLNQN